MLPWLVFTAGGIIVQITLVISFMIAVADYGAVAIFLGYEYHNSFLSKNFFNDFEGILRALGVRN